MEEEIDEGMLEERWAPIRRFEGLYDISDFGRVRSAIDRIHTFVGKILKPVHNGDEYCHVNLYKNGKLHRISIHSLVMDAFIGPRPEGMQINHKDGDKANNMLVNLEYVTPSENAIHAFRTKLRCGMKGEKNPRSKLIEENVHEIRHRLSKKETQESIAARFGVKREAISKIARGVRWAYLKEEEQS